MGRRIEELWPLSGLRVRTGPLELRPPSDDDVAELAELTREPIHDPATMPFFRSWTDEPEERRVRSVLQWNWRARAEWSQEEWHLVLAVAHEGTLVGCQGIQSKQFAATKEVETGSWLGRRHQGQGIGTAMRRAVLHLAFAGLGAETARSGAFFDNPASQKVSERLGYERDGTEILPRRGEGAALVRYLMTRSTWEQRSQDWPAVTVEGLDGCRAEFGG